MSGRKKIAMFVFSGTCALLCVMTWLPGLVAAQELSPEPTRTVERFSFSFESGEVVEIDLTTNKPAEEIQADEFLTLELYDRRTLVLTAQFNLALLPLITVSAETTGYGKATLTVNGVRSELVPVRRDRIYLQARAFVDTIERDYLTDKLTLIPSDTTLKGLMTFVDADGGRRTRTVVTTSMKIRTAEE